MAYDVNTFPRSVYHTALATGGHLGHPLIPEAWLESQISPNYPREEQFMWSFPPYCVFVLGENNEPEISTCYLKTEYNEQLTTAGGTLDLVTACVLGGSVTFLVSGTDRLVDGSGRYLFAII